VQLEPAVLYAPEAHRFYVAWADERGAAANRGYDIYGRWLEADGTPASPDLPAAAYAHDQRSPAVAYDPQSQQGALVWTDFTNGPGDDIYLRLGVLDTTPPTAQFTRDPTVGPPGTAFVLDASASHDDLTPAGALLVRWDWNSDGTWDTQWSPEKVVTHGINTPGDYTITLAVRDLVLNTGSVSQTIRVVATANTPPQAALTVAALQPPGRAGEDWGLNALDCTDAETPVGDLRVRWDWENDGVWDTQWSPVKLRTHPYTVTGLQLARVEVQDGGGLTDAAVRALLVLPGPPASLQVEPGEVTLAPGGSVQFRATARDAYDNVMHNPPVEWSMQDVRAGAIDAEGVLTAGSRAGTYPDAVLGTFGADSVDDTATVTIVSLARSGVYLPLVVRGP
jgi:PKD repeat protein